MQRVLVVSLVLALGLVTAPAGALPDVDPPALPSVVDLSAECVQRLPLDGEPLEADNHVPFGVLVPCPGVRPGARVWIENGGGCTLNFVFRGTSRDETGAPVDEGLFIGTAGHCVGGDGEQVWAEGDGPAATDGAGDRFGEVAYALLDSNQDFALIRIDDAVEEDVEPALCHFGGPDAVADAEAGEGDVVHHFGQGLGYGNTVPGRSGVVVSGTVVSGPGLTLFKGAVIFGDSGSPLMEADDDALAVVVAILLAAPTVAVATNIAPQLERATATTGIDFELVEGETH